MYKSYIKNTFIGLLAFLMVGCADESLTPIVTLDIVTLGAYPRAVVRDGSQYDLNNAATTSIGWEVEFVSGNKGENVETYEVYVKLNSDGTYKLIKSLGQSDFSTSADGNRSARVDFSLTEVLTTLSLTEADITPLDKFIFDGFLIMDDGRKFGYENSDANINGSSFNGLFRQTITATCPMADTQFVGDYQLSYVTNPTGFYGAIFGDTPPVATLAVVNNTRRKIASLPYVPDNADINKKTAVVNIDFICDYISVPTFNSGLKCVENEQIGQGTITNFIFADDSYFEIELIEFPKDRGCGQSPATVVIGFTKL